MTADDLSRLRDLSEPSDWLTEKQRASVAAALAEIDRLRAEREALIVAVRAHTGLTRADIMGAVTCLRTTPAAANLAPGSGPR